MATKKVPEGFELGENDDPETLFRYRGEWDVEKALSDAIKGDRGLVAKTSAAHHAISVSFPKVLTPEGKDLVVQYDLKLQEDLQCGGAYIKLLTDSKQGIKYAEFDDQTPYTIMFGPDKCGSTNKVHFIFRHQNPKTLKWEEKHLQNAPAIRSDTKTHLYTLIVHPDNTFEIRIDQEKVKSGSLLEDFDPPVNPPKEIDDPTDKKPEDWVDEPKIADPDAKKPEDWDEDAPRLIPDEEAVKPDDWLEDEPEFVEDPSAEKPEDWDEEEDGKWVAPKVPNPKCAKASGCGPWQRPNKPNPEYKGKWYPPMIDNPAYKGPWAPKKIANPDYFEDKLPSKFTPISGLGIEIWTMQGQIMFDNFYVGHSVEDAEKFAQETFQVKKSIEEKAEEAAKKKAEETAAKEGEKKNKKSPESLVETLQDQLNEFVTAFQVDPLAAVQGNPNVAAAIAALFLSPLLLYFLFARGGSGADAKAYAQRKKKDESTPDVKDDAEDADDEKEDTNVVVKKKKTNKEE